MNAASESTASRASSKGSDRIVEVTVIVRKDKRPNPSYWADAGPTDHPSRRSDHRAVADRAGRIRDRRAEHDRGTHRHLGARRVAFEAARPRDVGSPSGSPRSRGDAYEG